MKILLATNNQAKIARIRKLLTPLSITCLTLEELNIQNIDVKEGSDIVANAIKKAEAYRDQTELPILANDAAFSLEGETLDPAKVKRNALSDKDEFSMTQEEIAQAMVNYYKNLVQRQGKHIEGQWRDCFALSLPSQSTQTQEGLRPVLLTDKIVGKLNPYFPLRSMYIIGPTGKYVAEQTEEDKLLELKPLSDALKNLFF